METGLPNFKNASVLVLGDIMLDRYWFGETARISPEAPVPIVKIKQLDERPGGAGNVALNIAALGAKVTLLGITGEDEAGHALQAQLTAREVHHEFLHFKTIPTITKLRIISRQQQLIRLDFEEKFPLFDADLLIQLYQKHLKNVNLVILSDYNKGTLSCTLKLIELANAASIPIFVDPKGADFSIYRNATAITPNLKEFEAIVGPCSSEAEIVQKGKAFLLEHHIQSLLLTRGERGMTLIQPHTEEVHLPARALQVFDVTGAGDTVIALFGAAYAAGSTLTAAMKIANLGASLVVTKLGTASVSVPELQVALTRETKTTAAGIVNEEQLLENVTAARLKGKKIVFTNGCFDILHIGHVTYLQQAKQLGDYLIVAINDDQSVKRLKGSDRPINHTEQRMAVLAGLGVVDWVISFADDTPERLLKKLQPDVLVKGGDYQIDQVVGADTVQAYGGEIRVLGVIKDVSTSLIIDRMLKTKSLAEAE